MKTDVRSGNLKRMQSGIKDDLRFFLQPMHVSSPSFSNSHCEDWLSDTVQVTLVLVDGQVLPRSFARHNSSIDPGSVE